MKQTFFTTLFFRLLVFIFLGISIFSSTLSFAQQQSKQDQNTQNLPNVPYQEAGRLFVKNYSPKEYNAATQNWAVEQGENGIIYIGNTTHLLSFDGKTWERTKIGGTGLVRSLGYSSSKDKMYIGGVGDIGYSYVDSLGKVKYISLLNQVPKKYKKFDDVWKTLVLEEEVFFLTKDFILKYAANKFEVIEPRVNTFLSAFVTNGKLYVQESKLGVFEYKNDFLKSIENTDFIYQDLIVGMINYSENVSLIATQSGNFYTYNVIEKTINKFEIEQKEFFERSQVYSIEALKNEQIAIGTANEGIVIINKNGTWKNQISELKGLQDKSVWNLHADKNGDLWAALTQGVSHIQTSWAYTYFGEQSRINKANEVIRFNDILYTATEQGLSYYDTQTQVWENIDGILGQVWDLEIYQYNDKNSALLIAGQAGIFVLNPLRRKIEKVSEIESRHFLIDQTDRRRVFISTSEGLKVMVNSYEITDTYLEEPLNRIVQIKSNQLWAETQYKGILKIDVDFSKEKEYEITAYDSLTDIPNVEINQLVASNNQLFLATSEGIYYLDTLKNEFTSAIVLDNTKENTNFSASNFINADVSLINKFIHYSKKSNEIIKSYWVVKNNHLLYYKNDTLIESAILSLPSVEFYSIYEDPKYTFEDNNNVTKPIFTWVSTSEGLYRYDNTQIKKVVQDSLKIFLRHIKIRDSLVSNFKKHKLPNDFSSFTVQMSSPAFGKNEKLLYRYRLLPSTTKWSPWLKKDNFEFAILPFGEYTLEIQAKNEEEQLSNTFLVDFEVATAWYQRWWAYLIYVGIIFLIAVVFTYLYDKNLKTKNKELNALITERTQEISQKTEELEAQQQELLNQSQEVYNQKEELASQAEYLKKANKEVVKQKRALESSNKRLKKLSDITQEITSILDTKELVAIVFQRVIALMPAEGFGVGLLNENKNTIEFNDFIEKGVQLEAHEDSMEDTNRPSVECLITGNTIAVNNVAKVWKERFEEQNIQVEKGDLPYAFIYVPLIAEGHKFGVMTVQTFYEMDYSEQDILLLQSIGSATAIALSNIKAYNLIEQKNREVTDSIRYAQTIQESILPTEKEIKRSVGDHYIIYQPKDIVSGDFYWIGYSDGYQYAAVVDCTGHGVPGAFMSMVGSSLLREILYEKEITSPADMLEHLDDSIRLSLRQTGKEGSNTDGMDMILIRYTYKDDGKIELEFAGAKRPLIYKEPEGEIIQLRGTSRSIGGIQRKKKPFKEEHLVLLPRTMLFLTSDGLIDQPNKERKKYGTKRFLEKISEWGHLPISLQKASLLEDLESFREEEEQRDDITIMAINL
ncbi:SpoIIE family protein phosphatase [Bernardetia sp. ABR2-2B]|uniref:SpoIIE family protein phosphatase n=1 Tax=Bernardetia sp. ABR2-2B TaxID=3127472 RepID=UPI0030D42AD7